MRMMIEKLCERYLSRRGRVVLPRAFCGVAFGNCIALRTGPQTFEVELNAPLPFNWIVALNNTIVMTP